MIMLFPNTLIIPIYLPKSFPWSSKDYLLPQPPTTSPNPQEAETDHITTQPPHPHQAPTLSYSHSIPSLISQMLFPKISKHRVLSLALCIGITSGHSGVLRLGRLRNGSLRAQGKCSVWEKGHKQGWGEGERNVTSSGSCAFHPKR